MISYSAFGLSLRSNLPLPGLIPGAGATGPFPVTIVLGSLPAAERGPEALVYAGEDVGGVPAVRVGRTAAGFRFDYHDGTRFVLSDDGARVWGSWPHPLTADDAATYLLGPILAFVLRLRRTLALHAAVFEAAGGAVAVAGGPEAGKSTLAAALAQRGVRVLGDDVAPLREREGCFFVQPTVPRVRLWPDAAARLFGASAALPRLTPNWDKRFLDLGERAWFCDVPLPLRAVLVLDGREDAPDAPRVARLTSRDALLGILGHLHSVWMHPREPLPWVFEQAARVAASVPVLRVVPHRDPARIPHLCDAVIDAATRAA